MTDHIIDITDLSKRFGRKTALNQLSLQIPAGGVHAIVGSNGAGKSTLFRVLLGLQTADSGDAFVLGESSQHLSPETRGKIGYVNEEHTLPGWMRVESLLKQQRSTYTQWDQDLYKQVINNFDVDPKQKVSGLSRGERAGFNLSMALAQRPELLILDEPTLGLDVVAKRAFLEALIFSVNPQETTTIYCSHQMDEIERVADMLVVMEHGTVKNFSTPHEFLQRVSFWIADFDDRQTDLLDLPGLLSARIIDQQHHIFALDRGKQFAAELKLWGAHQVQQAPFSLDQAVNAFLAKNHTANRAKAVNHV